MLLSIRSLTLASAALVAAMAAALVAGLALKLAELPKLVAVISLFVTFAGFLVWRWSLVLEGMVSRRDPLTGALSRGEVLSQISSGLRHGRRIGGAVGILSIDVERFGHINSVYGQVTGDAVLKELYRRIQRVSPGNALVARMGGDEFLVVISGSSEAGVTAHCRRLCEMLADCLSLPVAQADGEVPLRVRIGGEVVAPSSTPETMSAEDVVSHAAMARQSCRRDGGAVGACYTLFDREMVVAAARNVEIEREMVGAIKADEFSVVYQPIVDVQAMKTVKCEALLRWSSARLGAVSPNEFIPVAERSGQIDALGLFVLNEACAQCARWLEAGHKLVVTVNVSATQMRSEGFFREVERALRRHMVPAGMLELELTEGVVVGSDPVVQENLSRIGSAGIRVALDDFGTGFSSLSYLSRLNIQTIKIDKSFVNVMCEGEREMRVVELICAIGNSLGYELIAEGVESPGQARELEKFGVRNMQGYLFSPPMSHDRIRHTYPASMFRRQPELAPVPRVVEAV